MITTRRHVGIRFSHPCPCPCKITKQSILAPPKTRTQYSALSQRAFCAVARPTRCPKPRYSSKESVGASPPPRGEPYWRKTAPHSWAASLLASVAATQPLRGEPCWPTWHHDTSSSSYGSRKPQTTRHSRRRRSRRRRRPCPRLRGTTRKPVKNAATRRKGKTTTRTAARSGTGCPASATTR